jgi:hypothetical protein
MMNTQSECQRRHRLIPITLAVALVILLRFPIPAYSQKFLFGGKLAGQITNTFTYPGPPPGLHEDRVLVGPMAEMRLAHGISVELDALYKRKLDYSSTFSSHQPFSPTGTIDVTNHSWELPLILKWRLPMYRAPIFVGAGFSARHVAGMTHTYGSQTPIIAGQQTSFDYTTSQSSWTYGPVVTAGFDLRAHIFHFQPEVRYARWNDSPFLFFTKPDSVEALIGISIGK